MHITLVDSMDSVLAAALLPPIEGDEHEEHDEAERDEHRDPAAAREYHHPDAEPDLLTDVEPENDLPAPLGGMSREPRPRKRR
jgi:hypothetical protein